MQVTPRGLMTRALRHGDRTFMMDSATGSHWNFQGCAIEGKLQGACLEPVQITKDLPHTAEEVEAAMKAK